MLREPEWSDWRIFLAVARHGSTMAAGRALRISQSTASRRVSALEEALEVKLFERRAAGYRLTDAGTALLATAEKIEAAAVEAETVARSHGRSLRGSIRVTSEEIFAVNLMAPIIREFHERYPEIAIELDSSSEVRDLGAGEADIALRATKQDQPAGVVGRSLGTDDWTLYVSRGYAEEHGVPRTRAELLQHNIVGGGGGGIGRAYAAWLEHVGLQHRVTVQYGSSSGLLAAVKSGLGVAVLPCILADADDDLIQCIPPRPNQAQTLWLLTHERIRHNPAVRAAIDFLYDSLTRHIRGLATRRALIAEQAA